MGESVVACGRDLYIYIYSYRDVCVCGHVNECSFIIHLHVRTYTYMSAKKRMNTPSAHTQHTTFQVAKMRQLVFWGTLDETQKRHPLRTIAEDRQRHSSKTVFKHATSIVWRSAPLSGAQRASAACQTCRAADPRHANYEFIYDISMNPILPFFKSVRGHVGICTRHDLGTG